MSVATSPALHAAAASFGPGPHAVVRPRANAHPTLRLAALLAQAGEAVMARLPTRAWVEATVRAVRPGAHGHSLELTDNAGGRGGDVAQLRAFLGRDTMQAIGREMGAAFDPTLMVGITTCLLLAPSFSPRWHLSARILGISVEARASLSLRAVEQLRQELRTSGLYDKQRHLATPADITRIAVVAPSGAAGYADIAAELARWQKAGLMRVSLHPTPYKGERAPAMLTAALVAAAAPADGERPDIVVLVRSGGASAGLQTLDHATVVRAICRCPVPVLTGIGHAIDRTLADEVAWRAADTPSKAVAVVARLMGAAAAEARAAGAAISRAARLTLAAHQYGLDRTVFEVITSARHGAERADADLVTAAAVLHGCGARLREGLDCHRDDLDRLWRQGSDAARAVLDGQAEERRRDLEAVAASAERLTAGADTGAASLATAVRAAAVRVATALSSCDALWRDVLGRAGDHLTAATAELTGRAGEIAGTDLPTLLGRGYAVVTDASGKIIRTPTAARAASRVTLILAGGSVLASIERGPQPITPGDHL